MIQEQKKYSDDKLNSLSQHIFDMLVGLSLSNGVLLYVGIGDTAIVEKLSHAGLPIVYIDINGDADEVALLKAQGIDAHSYQFTNAVEIISFFNEILDNRRVSAISVIDILAFLPNPEELGKELYKLSIALNASLIVSVPNITHKSVVFSLMEGEYQSPASFFSHNRLEHIMQNCGFILKQTFDFTEVFSQQHFQTDSIFHLTSTTIHQYLSWIKEIVDPFGDVVQFLRLYSPSEIPLPSPPLSKQEHRPFLSVVTRTQGKRPQALQETLLCLSAQTNTDFEVLLIGHRLTHEDQATVEQCIEDLPDWLNNKVRYFNVKDGNRTKPLHIGFTEARGKYIAILDDDDLVFDNWVEVFFNLEKSYPGTVLHAYSVSQDWKKLIINGNEVLQATGSPQPLYCNDFDYIRQLYVNGCPSMSYAIPSYVYQKLGVQFNLELSTTEDWDLLMRAVFLCGVSEAHETTSIYRLWDNIESSKQAHNQDDWEQNQAHIIEMMNQMPIVIPPGSVNRIIDIHEKSLLSLEEHIPTIFIDDGNGLIENGFIEADSYINTTNTWVFSVNPDTLVHSIRIDPGERGMIIISKLKITIEDKSGNRSLINTDSISTNGKRVSSGLLFVNIDPQIKVELLHGMGLRKIEVFFKATVPSINDLHEFGLRLPITLALYSHIRRLLSALKKYGLIKVLKKSTRKILNRMGRFNA